MSHDMSRLPIVDRITQFPMPHLGPAMRRHIQVADARGPKLLLCRPESLIVEIPVPRTPIGKLRAFNGNYQDV